MAMRHNRLIGGTFRGRYFSEIDHPAEPGVSEIAGGKDYPQTARWGD
jgi:hypothetical protein